MNYDPKELCTTEELLVTSIENDPFFEVHEVKQVDSESVTFVNGFSLFIDEAESKIDPGDVLRLYGRGFGYTVRGVSIVKNRWNTEILRYRTPLEDAIRHCQDRKKRDQERAEQTEKNRKEVDVDSVPLFKCNDLEKWRSWVEANMDPYGRAIMVYAENWAELMEKKMAGGATLRDIAKDSSHEADTAGISGFMYGCAVGMLSEVWEHGEALRNWHNLGTQIGTEGEKANKEGGVLNPALLNIGG